MVLRFRLQKEGGVVLNTLTTIVSIFSKVYALCLIAAPIASNSEIFLPSHDLCSHGMFADS